MFRLKFFTLIELLVVVAIIGILASMILPSLSKARKTAMGGVCISNLKQFALAATLYADSNKGKFPDYDSRKWVGKKGTNSFYGDTITQRPLNEYLGLTKDGMDARALMCPFNHLAPDLFNKVGSSYTANWYLKEKDISSISKPSITIVGFGFGAKSFVIGGAKQWWRQTHSPGKARYSFARVDGSAVHHTVIKGEGYSFRSKNVNLVLWDY